MLDQLYTRYVGASVASLGVDFAIFMTALSLGLLPAPAAASGYIAGRSPQTEPPAATSRACLSSPRSSASASRPRS